MLNTHARSTEFDLHMSGARKGLIVDMTGKVISFVFYKNKVATNPPIVRSIKEGKLVSNALFQSLIIHFSFLRTTYSNIMHTFNLDVFLHKGGPVELAKALNFRINWRCFRVVHTNFYHAMVEEEFIRTEVKKELLARMCGHSMKTSNRIYNRNTGLEKEFKSSFVANSIWLREVERVTAESCDEENEHYNPAEANQADNSESEFEDSDNVDAEDRYASSGADLYSDDDNKDDDALGENASDVSDVEESRETKRQRRRIR